MCHYALRCAVLCCAYTCSRYGTHIIGVFRSTRTSYLHIIVGQQDGTWREGLQQRASVVIPRPTWICALHSGVMILSSCSVYPAVLLCVRGYPTVPRRVIVCRCVQLSLCYPCAIKMYPQQRHAALTQRTHIAQAQRTRTEYTHIAYTYRTHTQYPGELGETRIHSSTALLHVLTLIHAGEASPQLCHNQ